MNDAQKPVPLDPLEALVPKQKQLLGNAVNHSGKPMLIGAIMVAFAPLRRVTEGAFSFASLSSRWGLDAYQWCFDWICHETRRLRENIITAITLTTTKTAILLET